MSTQGHFRSAISGFNRSDVVDFIETQSMLHKKEKKELEQQLTLCQQQLEQEQKARVDAVKQCYYELEAQKTATAGALALCQQLEAQPALSDQAKDLLTQLKDSLTLSI